ncbi:MAG: type II toxin-antitoxin system RelE/ParE family toxin [Nitrospiraceae bacterium]
MTASFTLRFRKQYQKLSEDRQAKFDKQLAFLLSNLRHPSLRAKKYNEAKDIWQARVDDDYRFYFIIDGDSYILLSIIPHPK